jgi:hypothetical protein
MWLPDEAPTDVGVGAMPSIVVSGGGGRRRPRVLLARPMEFRVGRDLL